jgi:germination protein M
MKKRKLFIGVLVLIIFSLVATGCVFGPKEDASAPLDPPQQNYTEGEEPIVLDIDGTSTEENAAVDGEVTKEVDRTLYLFDHQGYVVPLTVKLPHTQSVATQSLQYLVSDGPVTELLPNGMRAVLPAGTELSVKVDENGVATVDFSKEFSTYKAEDEKAILEAITWTLTQFNTIKSVNISINGYPQDVMPVNGTPIGKSVSRQDGINIEVAENTKIGNNSVITLYFKSQNPGATREYYVPVSRIVPRNDNLVASTVNEMIRGPKMNSGLFSDINATTTVDITVDGEVATLNFDEKFLNYANENPQASDDALDSLVLSLTESGLVQKVQFMVNGESKNLVSAQGDDLSKPVSRPVTINASSF